MKTRGFFTLILVLNILAQLHAQWQSLQGPTGGVVSSLLQHNQRLFLGTQNGVYHSDDLGTNWTFSSPELRSKNIYSLAAQANAVFAITDNSPWFFRSDNQGSTWMQPTAAGLPSNLSPQQLIGGDSALFLATHYQLFRSFDQGETWELVSLPTSIPYYYSDFYYATGRLIADFPGKGLYVSSDYGNTWINLAADLPGDYATGFIHGQHAWAQTTANLFYSSDGGQVWSIIGLGVGGSSGAISNFFYDSTNIYWAAGYRVSQAVPGMPFVQTANLEQPPFGMWFHGHSHTFPKIYRYGSYRFLTTYQGVFRASLTNDDWTELHSGLVNTGVVAVRSTGSGLLVSESSRNHRFLDSSNTWTPNLDPILPGAYIISFSEVNGVLFAGTAKNIWQSEDQGWTWTSVLATTAWTQFGQVVSAGDTLLANSIAYLFRSLDAGLTWEKLPDVFNTGFPYLKLAKNGNIILNGYPLIYRSDDGGNTWTVPDSSVNGLLVAAGDGFLRAAGNDLSFSSDGIFWVSAGLEVPLSISGISVNSAGWFVVSANDLWVSSDNGQNWVLYPNDLPAGLIISTLFSDDTWLYAGTNTEGLWRRPLPDIVPTSRPNHSAIEGALRLLPNPVFDQVRVEVSNVVPGQYALQLINTLGQVVHEETFVQSPHILNCRALRPGVYVARLCRDGKPIASSRFVVAD